MKLRVLPILSALLILAGCAVSADNNGVTTKATDPTYKQVSMSEAAEIIKSESDYIILDVRRPDEFAEGHIPGAINIPNESIGNDEIPALPDKNRLILVYCRSGRRSKEASAKLVKSGYTNIVEIGGILDWTGEIEK